jgi:hypothetical protein
LTLASKQGVGYLQGGAAEHAHGIAAVLAPLAYHFGQLHVCVHLAHFKLRGRVARLRTAFQQAQRH